MLWLRGLHMEAGYLGAFPEDDLGHVTQALWASIPSVMWGCKGTYLTVAVKNRCDNTKHSHSTCTYEGLYKGRLLVWSSCSFEGNGSCEKSSELLHIIRLEVMEWEFQPHPNFLNPKSTSIIIRVWCPVPIIRLAWSTLWLKRTFFINNHIARGTEQKLRDGFTHRPQEGFGIS